MRAFEAAARHLSFAQAAEELHVTPSALSYQIRNLEDHLGVPLFLRLNRAVELTDAGRRIYPGIQEAFDRLTDTIGLLEDVTPDHILVVSTGPAFAAKWLTPRLYKFVDQYPDIELRIAANLKMVSFVDDQVDVAVRLGGGHYPGLTSVPLAREWVTPMIAPSLIRAHGPIEAPSDIARFTLLHDDARMGTVDNYGWADWFRRVGAEGVNANRGPRFNHSDHAIDAAIEGGGVVMGRSLLTAGDIRHRRLVAPFPEDRLDAAFGFYLVYPQQHESKPKIELFRNWILAEIKADDISSGDRIPKPIRSTEDLDNR